MLREIEASGRRNYSLFLADDGELIGYFEVDDLDASEEYLAHSAVAAEWEASMQPFFDGLEGRADQAFRPLEEVFNLADRLAELPTAGDTPGGTTASASAESTEPTPDTESTAETTERNAS